LAKAAEKSTHANPGDGVSETFRPLTTGFEDNWKTIVIVTSVALAVLLVVALVLQSKSRHSEQAAQSVGDALENIEIPVVAAEPPAPGDAAAPGAKPDAKAKADTKADAKPDTKKAAKTRFQPKDDFPTEEAKQEAIAKQAQQTISDFPSQPAARVAELALGDAQYKLGKFADAAQAYSKFLAEAPETDYTRAYAEVGMAYAMLGMGKKDEALAAAKALVERPPGGFGRDLGLLTEGHIAEDVGQQALAKEVYRALRGEAPDSAAGREATERLTFLGEPPVPQKPMAMGTPGAKSPVQGSAPPAPAN
jgi:tetratricopeptide (TPR) repeat protein